MPKSQSSFKRSQALEALQPGIGDPGVADVQYFQLRESTEMRQSGVGDLSASET